ncbi:hypothetical protein GGS20DRAFT_583673 [Poronia punctata]|nr:hypothetical protein GGS20DRAFT_583673 [Poronia punctata]
MDGGNNNNNNNNIDQGLQQQQQQQLPPPAGSIPQCLYVQNCDTRSVPRKAISHIFGRNKMCTRAIPDEIWVHFCRKHYQRGRYRNSGQYARVQCELVVTQIGRIRQWSESNKARGLPGHVKNWSLCLRKREKDRLRLKESKREEVEDVQGGDDVDADDEYHPSVVNGWSVPVWLRQMCRDGYTTEEIEVIAQRIMEDVNNGNLIQMPDVEFLPNVITDDNRRRRRSSNNKRKSTTTTTTTEGAGPIPYHRRSQSDGTLVSGNIHHHHHNHPAVVAPPHHHHHVPMDPAYWPMPAEEANKRQRTEIGGEEEAYPQVQHQALHATTTTNNFQYPELPPYRGLAFDNVPLPPLTGHEHAVFPNMMGPGQTQEASRNYHSPDLYNPPSAHAFQQGYHHNNDTLAYANSNHHHQNDNSANEWNTMIPSANPYTHSPLPSLADQLNSFQDDNIPGGYQHQHQHHHRSQSDYQTAMPMSAYPPPPTLPRLTTPLWDFHPQPTRAIANNNWPLATQQPPVPNPYMGPRLQRSHHIPPLVLAGNNNHNGNNGYHLYGEEEISPTSVYSLSEVVTPATRSPSASMYPLLEPNPFSHDARAVFHE